MKQALHKSVVCMVVIQTMVNMLAVTNQEIFHLLRLQFSHHLSTVGARVCVNGPNEFYKNVAPYVSTSEVKIIHL